ncbi:MAG: NifB/NifX family molybdenum-iron cluster-binding protein [Deltaproteobacteria bacterium]|nr:NifB/NifX family molybdenum-iron cluster-binding protein [Deltaproteobacteria bacterium]
MKIAFAATGTDLDAKIERRLGQAKHLLIVDSDTGDFESLDIPFKPEAPGLGINISLMAMEKGSRAIVAGYISPRISSPLSRGGIKVVNYRECSIRDFLDAYKNGEIDDLRHDEPIDKIERMKLNSIAPVMRQTALQFLNMTPVLMGVVLLIGLVRSFLKDEILLTLFSGEPIFDTVLGAFAGSIFTGMPVNSYLIGDALLKMGVSPFAITALLMTWVSVGLAQLPAEIAALGRSFGLSRIIISYIVSVIMALIMGVLMGIIK